MTLRVLTFNAWAIPFAASDVQFRIAALTKALAELQPDIVGFQELAIDAAKDLIFDAAQAIGLTEWHDFQSVGLRNGLVTLSRYKIQEVDFLLYRPRGKVQRLNHMDYYAGKGVGLMRMLTPEGVLDVYNTQTISKYGPDFLEEYKAYRVAQVLSLADWTLSRSEGIPTIALGDFNMRPDNLEYRIVSVLGELQDSYAIANPGDNGYTSALDNIYRVRRGDWIEHRIDYIFFRNAESLVLDVASSDIVLRQVPDKLNGQELPYSDHYGVLTEFTLHSSNRPFQPPGVEKGAKEEVLTAAIQVLERGKKDAENRKSQHRTLALIGAIVTLALLELDVSSRLSRRDVFAELVWFLLMIAAACYSLLEGMLGFYFVPEESTDLENALVLTFRQLEMIKDA
jgi:sphingomyelin phosphodiesterase 2